MEWTFLVVYDPDSVEPETGTNKRLSMGWSS